MIISQTIYKVYKKKKHYNFAKHFANDKGV